MDDHSINNSYAEKDLGVEKDHKLYVSQQCHLAVRRANTILRRINRRIAC